MSHMSDGGRRFQSEGPATEKDLDLAIVVLPLCGSRLVGIDECSGQRDDNTMIERFLRWLERAGCVANDCVDINSLMDQADENLLMAVVWNAEHVLRLHFPPIILRRLNLR